MGTLFRIELNDEAKTTLRLGDPWPDDSPSPDGVPLSERYTVAAMFYMAEQSEEEVENDKGEMVLQGEDLAAHFEVWAQPKGIEDPPNDFPTFRMRLWLDSPMKRTFELWKWCEMKEFCLLHMGFDPDQPIEPASPPAAQNPSASRGPALTAATAAAAG